MAPLQALGIAILGLACFQDEAVRIAAPLKKGDALEATVRVTIKSANLDQYPLDVDMRMVVRYDVTSVEASGAASVLAKVRKVALKGLFPDGPLDIEWDNLGEAPVVKGKIPEATIKKWLAGFEAAVTAEGAFRTEEKLIKSRYHPEFFWGAYWGSFARFPKDPAKVGDSWTTTEENKGPQGEKLSATVKHAFARREGGSIVITSAYAATIEGSDKVLKGEGTTHFDPAQGFMSRATGKYVMPIVKTAGTFDITSTFETTVKKPESK